MENGFVKDSSELDEKNKSVATEGLHPLPLKTPCLSKIPTQATPMTAKSINERRSCDCLNTYMENNIPVTNTFFYFTFIVKHD